MKKEILNKIFSYQDGRLFWKIKVNSYSIVGTRAGYLLNGQRFILIEGEYIPEEKIIWCLHNGPIPEGKVIKHISSKNDYRIENLKLK